MSEQLGKADPTRGIESAAEIVIPLVGETLHIGKRTVETGIVRLQIATEEHTERIELPLTQTSWRVDHVPVNTVVESPPAPRVEGDTTIYPIVKERLVVTRELVLVEELHVTRVESTETISADHVVRRETVTEERLPIAR